MSAPHSRQSWMSLLSGRARGEHVINRDRRVTQVRMAISHSSGRDRLCKARRGGRRAFPCTTTHRARQRNPSPHRHRDRHSASRRLTCWRLATNRSARAKSAYYDRPSRTQSLPGTGRSRPHHAPGRHAFLHRSPRTRDRWPHSSTPRD